MNTFSEYEVEVQRTAARPDEAYPAPGLGAGFKRIIDVQIWALGLAGEAGEVCDLLKKVHGHGKPMDRLALQKELGDVLWYLTALVNAHGFTLAEVARVNASKLRARYPNGFSVAKADEQIKVGGGQP